MRPKYVLGYLLGIMMLVVGSLILTGALQLRWGQGEEGSPLRVTFGIVLVLYGIYRFMLTEMQRRREGRAQ